jgi:hypothetical protein
MYNEEQFTRNHNAAERELSNRTLMHLEEQHMYKFMNVELEIETKTRKSMVEEEKLTVIFNKKEKSIEASNTSLMDKEELFMKKYQIVLLAYKRERQRAISASLLVWAKIINKMTQRTIKSKKAKRRGILRAFKVYADREKQERNRQAEKKREKKRRVQKSILKY